MVAGSSGMPRPHPAVRATEKERDSSLQPTVCLRLGGVGNLMNNKIVKYCFDLFFSIIY